MKPSQIVFIRSYYNNLRACTKKDLKDAKEMKIYGQLYPTQDVVLRLMVVGHVDFSNKLPGRNTAGIKFQVNKKNVSCLLIDMYPMGKEAPLAQIEICNDADVAAQDQKYQGSVSITLSGNKESQVITTEEKKSLENFALAIGLFFLAVHDGKWDNPVIRCQKEGISIPIDTEDLQLALEESKKQLESKKMQMEQLIKEHNILCTRLEYQIKQNQKRITALTSNLKSYMGKADIGIGTGAEVESSGFIDDFDYVSQLKEILTGKRICLLGGKKSWQAKVLETFSDVVILEAKNFDPNKMDMSDILVINTNDVGHALTGKAQNIAGNKNIRIIFTGKYNMQRFAEEIIYNLK